MFAVFIRFAHDHSRRSRPARSQHAAEALLAFHVHAHITFTVT